MRVVGVPERLADELTEKIRLRRKLFMDVGGVPAYVRRGRLLTRRSAATRAMYRITELMIRSVARRRMWLWAFPLTRRHMERNHARVLAALERAKARLNELERAMQ